VVGVDMEINCANPQYCQLTLNEEQHMLKWVYSMMPLIQISFLLYKTEAGKSRKRSGRREKNREREA